MASLVQNPRVVVVDSAGTPRANAKRYLYSAGTLTPLTSYTESDLGTPHANPQVADSYGVFAPAYLPSTVSTYRQIVKTSADVTLSDDDDIPTVQLSAAAVGAVLYPRTTAEQSAGVAPTDYSYPSGNVLRYGADNTGVSDSTSAIQDAIDTGHDVTFPAGSYLAAGLTQSLDSQRFAAIGNVRIIKNANGAIFTSTGDEVELNGIGFRGDASSPTFTGDGVVMSGDNVRIINCGVRWISGVPLKCTGSAVQIDGTCDIYQTTDGTSGGYDIVIGVSGTATLYHRIKGIRTSQATGGIKYIDTGSATTEASQFGKLTVEAGTSPSGVNGGNFTGNRILGNVSLGLSSATFAGNTIGAVTITLVSGTSGHSIDDSNTLASGATITDSSTNSNVVDLRAVVPTTFTPTWTGASSNPAIGDGTLTGYYLKRGREVWASVRVVMGSTTTYGTGQWYFALPAIPSTGVAQQGSARALDAGTNIRIGVCETLTDGTARAQVMFDSDTAAADSGKPFTWASGDELRFTIRYFT